VTKIIPEPAKAEWKVMEVSRRSWIIGEGNGTLWSLVEDQRRLYDMSGRNLGRK
jgi:hypothetical protein